MKFERPHHLAATKSQDQDVFTLSGSKGFHFAQPIDRQCGALTCTKNEFTRDFETVSSPLNHNLYGPFFRLSVYDVKMTSPYDRLIVARTQDVQGKLPIPKQGETKF